MFNSQRLGLLKKWGLNSATFMQTHLCKNWKLVINECKWWIHMVLPQNWMASCSFQMNQSGHFSSEDCKHRVAWSQGKPTAKKTMLSAGWLKRGWDVPWVSESHQIQDAMNKNARRNLEIRWLVIVAVFFLLPQDSRFLMLSTHVFKKKPGQLELQMGDWYWPGAKFQVIPCLRSNILNILPSGYLTEPLEINIFL